MLRCTAVAWIMLLSATEVSGQSALLVVGDTRLNAGDAALKARLERHYRTTVRDDGAPADTSRDVIVISSSVAAGTLGTKYRATTKGVVVLDPAVLPGMGMVGAGAFGVTSGSRVQIVFDGTIAAGGFAAGTAVTVHGSARGLGWGNPPSSARRIALTPDGASTRATIFRYLKGGAMAGGFLAPGRRIAHFVQAPEALNANGWRLFDGSVASGAGLTAVPGTSPPPTGEAWPDPRWATVTPATAGMDAARTADALAYGRNRGGSGILVRGGRRVGAWGDQGARYDLRSTTKSFGAILLGHAIYQRKIAGLDMQVQPALPELGVPQSTAERRRWLGEITVRHLAAHAAGFAKPGGVEQLQFRPGTGWLYSDGGPNWIADLLTVSYERDLNQVLRANFLAPMGIAPDELVWRRNIYRPQTLRGIERREFGSGMFTSVDVMAKFGLLMLREGRWKDQRLMWASFVRQATRHQSWLPYVRCADAAKCPGYPPTDHYGLLFWTNADGNRPGVPRDAYWAAGQFTSFILVIPSLDTVVARAGPEWPKSTEESQVTTFFRLVASAVR